MKRTNGWRKIVAGVVAAAVALLAGSAGTGQAATNWWNGTTMSWNATGSWSTVSTAANPNPATVPGAADTVIFNISGVTVNQSVGLDALQSVYGAVIRSSGGIKLWANRDGTTDNNTLTLGSGGLTIATGSLANQVLGSSSRGAITIALGTDQVWRNFNTDVVGNSHNFCFGNQENTADADADLKGKILTIVGDAGLQVGYSGSGTGSTRGRIVDSGTGGSIALGANAVLRLSNRAIANGINTDRVADSAGIASYGGKVHFHIAAAASGYNFSETVGALTLAKGALNHVQETQASSGQTSTFTYGGLSRPAGSLATIAFNPAALSGLGDATAYARNKLVITGQAVTNLIGGWATIAGNSGSATFAAYDATRGVYNTTSSALVSGENSPAKVASASYFQISADTTLGALLANALLSLGTKKLTLVSGGLMFNVNNAYSDVINGTLTAGPNGGASAPLFVWDIHNASVGSYLHNLTAVIADNASGSLDLVKFGIGTLELGGANTYSGSTAVNEGKLRVNKSTTTSLSATGDVNGVVTVSDTSGLVPGQAVSGAGFALGSGRWITAILSSTTFKVNGSAIGSGTMGFTTLSGTIASSPTIEVLYGGTLDVTYYRPSWTLASTQTLKGNGTVVANEFGSNKTIQIDGKVAPGSSNGTLTVTGNLVFSNNSVLEIEAKNALLGGDKWESGYDRLNVSGTLDLGSNAKLDVKPLTGETLALGDRLFIIDNDASDAVSGKFKTTAGTVLNEGDAFAVGEKGFKVYYAADTATGALTGGNDVALEVVKPPSAAGTVVIFR